MIRNVDEVRTLALTPDQAKKFAQECKAKPAATLAAELTEARESLAADMKLASRSGEDGETIIDFEGVERYADMTESQIRRDFAERNDRMNIMGAVHESKTFFANLQNSIAAAAPDPEAPPMDMSDIRPAGMALATPGLYDLLGSNPTYMETIANVPAINRRGKGVVLDDIEGRDFLNAVFQKAGVSNSGWAPQIIRSGRIVLDDQRPDQLVDMLPMVSAMNGGYAWIQETALSAENTSNRVPRERAEGAAVEEITLHLSEKSVKVEKLGCYIPVTEEQLADEPGARAYLEMRLPQQVRQRLDYQALNGNGTAPNMQGFAGVSGINTYATPSSSKILDVFLSGAVEIYKDTFMLPNLTCVNVDDFKKIVSTKDDENRYLYGSPMQAAFMDQSVWGFRLCINDTLAANTAYMFNTADKLMVMGRGVELIYGYTGDDFIRNRVSIRCTLRANFADLKPVSTCKITALNNAS